VSGLQGSPGGGRLTDRVGIGVLTCLVPRDLVDEVLAETGRREKRFRLLPAHVVVYFVMAMAVFRDGYEEVMRRLVAAEIGTVSVGEREIAAGLASSLERGMLVISDRGFCSFQLWAEFLVTGADLLFRVASGLKLPVTRILPDGSYLSVVASHKARGSGFQIPLAAASDPRSATHIPVRVIEYTVTDDAAGRKPEIFRLVTTILDPDDVTASELAAAYQQRWEYEIALKEIETQMLEPGSGLPMPLRVCRLLTRWFGLGRECDALRCCVCGEAG